MYLSKRHIWSKFMQFMTFISFNNIQLDLFQDTIVIFYDLF